MVLKRKPGLTNRPRNWGQAPLENKWKLTVILKTTSEYKGGGDSDDIVRSMGVNTHIRPLFITGRGGKKERVGLLLRAGLREAYGNL